MRILVTDDAHPLLREGLVSLGFSIKDEPNISWEGAKSVIHDYDGIVINSKMIMNKEMLDAAPNLKFIARLGSGLDIIDLPLAKQRGVEVFSAPNGNANAVAEHAMAMCLMLANKLRIADAEVRDFQWNREKNRGFEWTGKTVGVIGFGNNGSAFAKKWQSWDVRILAHDKYKTNFTEGFPFVEEATLEQIQQEADVISLHIPLTDETHHYIDDAFLANCKKDIYLINTSRGKNLKTQAAIKALESGKIKGLCMDVFENEKPKTYGASEKELYSRLFSFQNTVFSPHIAGWTTESKIKIASILLSKIEGWKKGTAV